MYLIKTFVYCGPCIYCRDEEGFECLKTLPLEGTQSTGMAKVENFLLLPCFTRAERNLSAESYMFNISRSIQRFPEHFSKHLTLQLTVLRLDLNDNFLYSNPLKNKLSFCLFLQI